MMVNRLMGKHEMRKTVLFLSVMLLGGNAYSAEQKCVIDEADELSGKVDLEGGCTYKQSVSIVKSGSVMDCHGATLDGGGELKFGVVVNGKGKKIENVTIKNCKIQNFSHDGVLVTSGIQMSKYGNDHEQNYDVSPQNILLDSLEISNSGHVGVYIDSYSRGVSLLRSVVARSGGVGVYLEQSSKGNRIIGNTLASNGSSPEFKTKREAIAVDSSADNQIEHNKFMNNGAGGVFIYKNCGEHFSLGDSVLRWQSSDGNQLNSNYFEGERIGVWIASRQSKDLSKWGCGDKPVDDSGRYYADRANHNLVVGNKFCNVTVGVRIEGDYNRVENNLFNRSVVKRVDQPYLDKRKPGGGEVVGNQNLNNIAQECGVE